MDGIIPSVTVQDGEMRMKYIWKNLLCFIKYDTYIWLLFVLTVIVSAVLTCFSYGVYQNYHVLTKEKVGEETSICVDFDDTEDSFVTKEMLDVCLKELGSRQGEMKNRISICALDVEVDGACIECKFLLHEDSVAYADNVARNLVMYGHLTRGSYWSALDEREGNPVAICYDYAYDPSSWYSAYVKGHIKGEDTIEINGREYRITGYGTLDVPVQVPYSSLKPDTHMKEFYICFEEGVTLQTFELVKEVFYGHLAGKISIPDIEGISSDLYYLYRTVSLIVILMMGICALNSAFLYLYVLSKRRKQSAVMQICGLPEWKEYLMNIGECLLLGVPVYTAAVIIYAKFIMEPVSAYFPYMRFAYSPKVYAWMVAGYTGIAVAASAVLIIHKSRSIREMMG